MNLLETCKALLSAIEDFNRWHPSGELEGLIAMGKDAIASAKPETMTDAQLLGELASRGYMVGNLVRQYTNM